MNILKQTENYQLADVRGTHYSGSYQILEKIDGEFRTCGEYSNKKYAIQYFNKLSRKGTV